MATEKVKLRDYQQSILDKLEMIREDASNVPSNYLGVEISGRNVLINLLDITETLVVSEIEPVPLVKPWFLGMTNVRGILYAINDLGQLLDNQATEVSSNTRMLLISNDVSSNIGFLVDRLVGLRNFENMTKKKKTEESLCFNPERYEDEEGNLWYVLDCERLVSSKEFEVPYAV